MSGHMKGQPAALALLGLVAFAACAWGARGAPRVTLLNTGIRIEHPPARVSWGLAGAAGLALLAAAVPRRALRLVLAGAAVLAATLGAEPARLALGANIALLPRAMPCRSKALWIACRFAPLFFD